MSQQRITLFFPVVSRKKKASSNTRCLFLEILYSIRRQIYREAGLLSGATILMNLWATRDNSKYKEPFSHPYRDCQYESIPLGLFAVCRKIHEETTHILYGENRLAISRWKPRSLRILERFTKSTLAKIKFLFICLNLESCADFCCGHRERPCGNGYIRCSYPEAHDEPLDHTSTRGQELVSQWQQICADLSRYIVPKQLKLYIICDCRNPHTAEMITLPLLLLPTLRDFALRLGRDYHEDLQALAETTVLRLTVRPSNSEPPFRFLDLPKEIQLKILKYTDLVAHGEITCNVNRLLYPSSCPTSGAADEHIESGDTKKSLKCFCYSGHSAFTFRCNHYRRLGFPSALFLVSRKFLEAATEIFWGCNEFLIAMSSNEFNWIGIRPGMSRIPTSAIRFIKTLRFEFEPTDWASFRIGGPGWGHWIDAIELLSEYANLSIMTLEIRLEDMIYTRNEEEGHLSIFDATLNKREYEVNMLNVYSNFLLPIAILKGRLKNFFVHLNWGTSVTGDGQALDGREVVERKLESLVMGEEYDAWKRGKVYRVYAWI